MRSAGGPPGVVLFDVVETLSDLTPLHARFTEAGLPAELVPAWFAEVLRDGFALCAAGGYADFVELAEDGLRRMAHRSSDPEGAVRHVLDGLGALPPHGDVADGVRGLRAAGLRLATLTNGSVEMTARLLDSAGLRDDFEALLDVREPRAWKPSPHAYGYAVERLGVAAADVLLVAVHPWDVDGAQRAGLDGAWLARGAAAHPGGYPAAMTPPTLRVETLTELAARLTPGGGRRPRR